MSRSLLTYHDVLRYLFDLHRFGISPGLDRITILMSLLENPQKGFQSILVGGTNGKGSVCSMISNILMIEGYKVGLYTSPHLQRFTERMRIDNKEIDEGKVVELVNRIRDKILILEPGISKMVTMGEKRNPPRLTADSQHLPVTFFEFVTAMAFLYFFEEKVDIGVIEVGMGGRLDATNIIEPLVSVITNISHEHEDYLGRRIEDIAREKGGIIKDNGVLVTGAEGRGLEVLQRICKEKWADIRILGRDFYVMEDVKRNIFDYLGENHYKGLRSNLRGKHQINNAAIAVTVIDLLKKKGFKVDYNSIRKGLGETRWPGRLELIEFSGKRILLDSAHNPAGAHVLRNFLSLEISFKRLYLIIGIMRDKAIEEIIKVITPYAYEVILTRPEGPRAALIDQLIKIVKRYNRKIKGIENVAKALDYGLKVTEKDDLLCVTGSLFTVGEARKGIERLRRGIDKDTR